MKSLLLPPSREAGEGEEKQEVKEIRGQISSTPSIELIYKVGDDTTYRNGMESPEHVRFMAYFEDIPFSLLALGESLNLFGGHFHRHARAVESFVSGIQQDRQL